MIKKISIFFLAIWMAVFSAGFAVSQHFCGHELKQSGVFTEATSCEMKGMPTHSKSSQKDCHEEEQNRCPGFSAFCCSYVTHYLNNTTNIKGNIKVTLKVLNTLTDYFTGNFIQFNEFEYAPIQNYKPPLIEQDVPILFQSFLL